MAYQAALFDPRERQREKQASRESDATRLRSGQISPEALHHENGFLSALPISHGRLVTRHTRRARSAAAG